MNNIKNVLLVGAGNLGRRHLQGMKGSHQPSRLLVVEPHEDARVLAERMYKAAEPINANNQKIDFYSGLENIPGNIDIAVLATPATGRLEILQEILSKGVTDVVLEKIAFNSVSDIDAAKELMSEYRARGWINCPRRLNPAYVKIRSELEVQSIRRVEVLGENFGMACNAIHFIDLIAFLSQKVDYYIDLSGVSAIEESKRGGYIEFLGRAEGGFWNGPEFLIECDGSANGVKFRIKIILDDREYHIDEVAGKIEIFYRNNGQVESREFRQLYQSELTGGLLDSIIEKQDCGLTEFSESMSLHRPFVSAAYSIYAAKYSENPRKMVPIT